MHISLIIGAIKVLCWANNVIDLPVCTFFRSELATEIPPAGLKRPFCFCSVVEIYRMLHVHPIQTGPYHPQMDCLVERFNQNAQGQQRLHPSNGAHDLHRTIIYPWQKIGAELFHSKKPRIYLLTTSRDIPKS